MNEMITIERANKVLAEAAGIKELQETDSTQCYYQNKPLGYAYFNIERAECREIVRDWWLSGGKGTREVTHFSDETTYYEQSTEVFNGFNELECQLALAETLEKEK